MTLSEIIRSFLQGFFTHNSLVSYFIIILPYTLKKSRIKQRPTSDLTSFILSLLLQYPYIYTNIINLKKT